MKKLGTAQWKKEANKRNFHAKREFDDGTWYTIYQLNEFEIKRIKDHLNG